MNMHEEYLAKGRTISYVAFLIGLCFCTSFLPARPPTTMYKHAWRSAHGNLATHFYFDFFCSPQVSVSQTRDGRSRLSDCPGQLKVHVGQLNFPPHLSYRTSKIWTLFNAKSSCRIRKSCQWVPEKNVVRWIFSSDKWKVRSVVWQDKSQNKLMSNPANTKQKVWIFCLRPAL